MRRLPWAKRLDEISRGFQVIVPNFRNRTLPEDMSGGPLPRSRCEPHSLQESLPAAPGVLGRYISGGDRLSGAHRDTYSTLT